MTKNQLMLQVVCALHEIANSIETFLQIVEGEKTVEVTSTSTETTPQKSEPITIEKVRGVLASKSQSGKQPEVKKLIAKFGAKKLTDIDEACYEELLKEAEVL